VIITEYMDHNYEESSLVYLNISIRKEGWSWCGSSAATTLKVSTGDSRRQEHINGVE
jgi:hypothetical protein